MVWLPSFADSVDLTTPPDHLQPRGIHRRHQMCLYRHIPVCFSPMCRLVRLFLPPDWILRRLIFAGTSPCVYSFIQTNQSDVLDTPNLPNVVDGMRKICALESTLLGNVSETDGETTPTSSSSAATATGSSNHASPTVEVLFSTNGIRTVVLLVVSIIISQVLLGV